MSWLMSWMKNHKNDLPKWIGITLIIVALSIWIYSITELKSNEIMLATQNLGVEEVWQYEGALQWWKNTYTTTIIPITAILVTLGVATLLRKKLNTFAKKDILNKFEDVIKQACQIDQD